MQRVERGRRPDATSAPFQPDPLEGLAAVEDGAGVNAAGGVFVALANQPGEVVAAAAAAAADEAGDDTNDDAANGGAANGGAANDDAANGGAAPARPRGGRETEQFVRMDDLHGIAAEALMSRVFELMQRQQESDRRVQTYVQATASALAAEPAERGPSTQSRRRSRLAGPTRVSTCVRAATRRTLRASRAQCRCCGPMGARSEDGEFTCPVCRRIANVLVPILPSHSAALPATPPARSTSASACPSPRASAFSSSRRSIFRHDASPQSQPAAATAVVGSVVGSPRLASPRFAPAADASSSSGGLEGCAASPTRLPAHAGRRRRIGVGSAATRPLRLAERA